MKKLINLSGNVVEEMLDGLLFLHPDQIQIDGFNVLVRGDKNFDPDRKVSLIAGGGSGHEPAHAGYVGQGMLSAAVAGQVFTSPSANSVFAAIKAAGGRAGVVLIIKNYTGDCLNFGFAAEMARSEGQMVESIIVADDVALLDVQDRSEARGIAGTVLIHKIAGAAAEEGRDLAGVVAAARSAAAEMGSMGLSLSAGTSPATGQQSFSLPDDEVELGLGIHGEPGVRRMKLENADTMVGLLIERILRARQFVTGDRVVVLVNNLGATTPMELAIVARAARRLLDSRHIVVERLYAGTFLSSLDMAGISLSIVRVDDQRLRWLDAPTVAPAWTNQASKPAAGARVAPQRFREPGRSSSPAPSAVTRSAMRMALEAACRSLIQSEGLLTEMDRVVGDGDLGNNLARGAHALLARLDTLPFDDPKESLREIGLILQDVLGGSSGPLYGVLFLKASATLNSQSSNELQSWADAIHAGCMAITEIGGARAGDRTMLDALLPFAASLDAAGRKNSGWMKALGEAVAAAENGAAETAKMFPRRGRSRYLFDRALGHPDPGATAVSIWLRAVLSSFGSGER